MWPHPLPHPLGASGAASWRGDGRSRLGQAKGWDLDESLSFSGHFCPKSRIPEFSNSAMVEEWRVDQDAICDDLQGSRLDLTLPQGKAGMYPVVTPCWRIVGALCVDYWWQTWPCLKQAPYRAQE